MQETGNLYDLTGFSPWGSQGLRQRAVARVNPVSMTGILVALNFNPLTAPLTGALQQAGHRRGSPSRANMRGLVNVISPESGPNLLLCKHLYPEQLISELATFESFRRKRLYRCLQ